MSIVDEVLKDFMLPEAPQSIENDENLDSKVKEFSKMLEEELSKRNFKYTDKDVSEIALIINDRLNALKKESERKSHSDAQRIAITALKALSGYNLNKIIPPNFSDIEKEREFIFIPISKSDNTITVLTINFTDDAVIEIDRIMNEFHSDIGIDLNQP